MTDALCGDPQGSPFGLIGLWLNIIVKNSDNNSTFICKITKNRIAMTDGVESQKII